ncbi:uncharacterized protein [Panulirus ornatus]|uniref:uncharacterized protein isoform X2 n=1 Tax=Panulirus ornatus TaxID=150431 RepID=UPI003A841566
MTGDLVILLLPLLVILGASSSVSCSDPAASASSGAAGEDAVKSGEVDVKVYELQADVWAPASLDVFLRYSLSQKGYAASSEVSVCTRVKPSSLTPLEPYVSMSASDAMSDSLLIYRRGRRNSLMYNAKKQTGSLDFTTELVLHQWVHYCHIFSSGWYRAFVEGKERAYGYLETEVIPLPLNSTLTIGQEQDLVGEGFDLTQVFHGHVAQVNIWNWSLTQKEVEDMASCRRHAEGNVFSSDEDELENFGVSVETVKLHTLCEKGTDFVIFPEPRDLEASKLMCQRVGHVIFGPRTTEENVKLHNTSLQFVETCAANYHLWVGLTDEVEEGTWRRFSDNEVVNATLLFEPGQPNGNTSENCLFMAQGSGLWVDMICLADWLACVPCIKRQDPPLRLRGLCSRREPETYYEVLGYTAGKPYFHGFYGFMIYTVGQGEWHLKDIKKSEVLAWLKMTSANRYPIGHNMWTISAAVCGLFAGTEVELSLSACDDTQFTCANGDCIPKERRCDLRDDCIDHTDESDCSLVVMPESYRSGRPPDAAVDGGAAVDLAAVVHILRFMQIDDISRTVRLEMTVDIVWKDVRLKYLNLKEVMEGNRLSSKEMESVWRPSLDFPNLYDGNIKLQKEAVYLLKTGQPLPSDFNDVKMDTMYMGESALLTQKQHYIGTFACRFDMFYYPFDTQRCSALLQLSSVNMEVVAFSEDMARAVYLGDKDLPSYIITKYQVLVTHQANNNSTSYSVLSVEFELQRRWLVIVLSVFLPTTLLLIIGYSTLFVRVDRLQVRLTVSLTTLLVLYTLFNNTSDALPVTAYVKMIDMWFLYCIFLLFLISVCHVFVEHLEIRNEVVKVRPFHYTPPPRLTPRNVLQIARVAVVPTFVVVFNVVYWSLLLTSS